MYALLSYHRNALSCISTSIFLQLMCIQVLLEDLAHLYDGTDLAPIEIDFMEYARRTGIGEDARNEDREYWLNRIDNMPGGPSLPLKAPMESVKDLNSLVWST